MILVLAEQRDGVLNRTSWDAVAMAQQMGQPVRVVVLGDSVSAVARELAEADVDSVLAIEHPALGRYTADAYLQALSDVLTHEAPAVVFCSHTYQSRDVMPALAIRLGWGLVSDCVALRGEAGNWRYVRPIFQGRLLAEMVVEGPALVTWQAGVSSTDGVRRGATSAAITRRTVSVDTAIVRQVADAPFREARQTVDLGQAERIVAVGRGIKAPERLVLAETLAAALGAALGASRPICDAGWVPMERQIGSSGQTVAPSLYVALGVSGAIQHMVGMKGARTVVAINTDPDAPIFEVADYGIVADLFDMVPALIKELQG